MWCIPVKCVRKYQTCLCLISKWNRNCSLSNDHQFNFIANILFQIVLLTREGLKNKKNKVIIACWPTLHMVQLTFCVVWPSVCTVWTAFWAMCLTFCMLNIIFLKFFKVFWAFQREKIGLVAKKLDDYFILGRVQSPKY